jgi:integrase
MKTKFFLREHKAKLTINFEFRNASIRFRGATPFTVNSLKEWDEKAMRFKYPSPRVNAFKDNIALNEISTKFLEGLSDYKINEITKNQVKDVFENVVNLVAGIKVTNEPNREKVPEVDESDKIDPLNTVLIYFDFFIDKYQKHPAPSTKKVIKASSMRSYKSAKKNLELYLNENQIYNFTFDDICEDFYYVFVEFLNEKGFTLNYVGTIIRKLKTIMKSAFSRDITKCIEFQKPYFISPTEIVNLPYLTEDEIAKISNLVILDNNDRNIRDIFVLQCYTGFRIEDLLKQLKQPNIIEQNGRKFFYTKQGKTGGEIWIPINEKVRKMISNNSGKLPYYVHQNEINERIKSICKRAKIDENYSVERTYANKTVVETKPKHKFIATHTARRSFCTNAYMANVPVHHIMSISGHRTEKIFLHYVKVEKKLEAVIIAENKFFQ